MIDDLGIVARGNAWMGWRYAKHPVTGAEMAIGAMSKGGFLLADPRTQQCIHVSNSKPECECWAVAQSPDGSIYAALFGSGELLHWNWSGTEAQIVARVPGLTAFTIDVAPDGRVYLPHYGSGHLFRYDPRSRQIEDCGTFDADHLRNVCCAKDGLIYAACSTYGKGSEYKYLDPATGRKEVIQPGAAGSNWQTGSLVKDAAGRVLIPFKKFGRPFFHELFNGKVQEIAQDLIRLSPGNLPLAFEDGSYMTIPYREEVYDEPTLATYVDAGGKSTPFDIPRPEFPLRIFSVENGAGRIWCGTFIPLRLASYDPATGAAVHLGNPTHATGEIYNMAFSGGKLYMASYTSAPVARYVPDQPWRKDDGIFANPAHLGNMKPNGLQRPYGRAMDEKGQVYFSARGDYGCFDSGICKIDPATDEMTTWSYRNTFMGSLAYVSAAKQLLVSERRKGERAIRFTLISPTDGNELWSEPMIDDSGEVASCLDSGGDLVYGLHSYRATIFAFSMSQRRIVSECREMRFGEHCHNSLMFGLDGRIWGLTNEAVWSIDLDLKRPEEVANYRPIAYKNAYRFGMCKGPDGGIYFPNGPHLMRIRPR